jgi:hypothetical protein
MQQELLEKAFRRTTYNFISYRKYKNRILTNVHLMYLVQLDTCECGTRKQ